jgi:hypothetical protein
MMQEEGGLSIKKNEYLEVLDGSWNLLSCVNISMGGGHGKWML